MSLNDITLNRFPPYWRTMETTDLGYPLKLIERAGVIPVAFQKTAADAQAADATSDAIWRVPEDGYLLLPYYLPHAALTANASNYATLALKVSTTTKCAFATTVADSGNWVDNVAEPFAFAAAADRKVDAGDILLFTIAKAGDGVAVPVGVVQFLFAPRLAA
jgi:hypothetical protein